MLAAVFGANNPQGVSIDVGVARLEDVSVAMAFTGAFAAGWIFGVLCAAGAVVKMLSERRRLRRDLRLAEAQLRNLGNLSHDAD